MRHAYPVFLDLERKPCLVIGGGCMGEERIGALLAAGAAVTLISPAATERLAGLAAAGTLTWIRRKYEPGDLAGFFLAIIACGIGPGTRPIFDEAERAGVLVNSVDDPECCRFYHASVHRQGDLVIAISTSGKCPSLSVDLRKRFAAEFGPEYAEFLQIAGELRRRLPQLIPDFEGRRQFWRKLLASPVLADIRQGGRAAGLKRVEEILGA